jgi:acyl-CoA thioesterase-1
MWRRAGLRIEAAPRSYGKRPWKVQRFAAMLAVAVVAWLAQPTAEAAERPIKIVALGDSLMAGFQLPASAAFPAQLERALTAKGLAVEVVNAGVSGDTSAGGLGRLDWSVPDGTDAVIVELGANDMLRGIEPKLTRAALEKIIGRLRVRGIEVLCQRNAGRRMGRDYARAFDAIYPRSGHQRSRVLSVFSGSESSPILSSTQNDGLHPTAAGVATIVARILPRAEDLLARVRAKPAS